MKQYYGIVIAAVLPILGFSETNVRIDGVAAYANEHVITVSDVLKTSRGLQEQLSKGRNADDLKAVYQAAIEEVIARKLILDEYEQQKEIRIPDSVVDERIDGIVSEMFDGDRSALFEALTEDGLTEDAWREQIQEQIIVSAMRNFRVDSKVSVSPLKVREIYERDKEMYSTQPKVKIRMIVIAKGESEEEKVAQSAKLKTVKLALKAEDSFADVATAYSQDSRAAEGGDRGWMERDMLREDIAEVAFATGVGEVSEALDIGKQFCILKIEDRVDAETVSFDRAQPRIERQLRMENARELYESWIAHLRKNAYVKIVDNVLVP